MSWKGIKCENCHRDLGCPTCGELFQDLRMVSEEYENRIGEEVTVYFCNSECRNAWKEKRKRIV